MHKGAPMVFEYVPVLHNVQVIAPSKEYVPAAHVPVHDEVVRPVVDP